MPWQQSAEYHLLNWCREGLPADEKLLTHWLCHITDRQMPFRVIWNTGGYLPPYLAHARTAGCNRPVEGIFHDHGSALSAAVRLHCGRDGPDGVQAR